MKKRIVNFFSICVSFIFILSLFVGCSPYKELEKASKGISSYKITAVLDDEMTISATEDVVFVNNTDVILNTVCFNLYGRAFREDASVKPYTSINEAKCFPNGKSYGDMEIKSVKIGGEEAKFSIVGKDDNALEVSLEKELEPDEKVLINIEFVLRLAENAHRLGYLNESVNLGNWFPIIAVYERGEYIIEPYYSTGDPFYSQIANFEVDFTYGKDYFLSSTGNAKRIKEIGDVKQDKIKAKAVRDFAIMLTKNSKTKSKKIDELLVSYTGYEEDENIDYCLDVSVKAVKFFCKIFGDYPYKKLDVVKAPFLHGGMEYPAVVIVSDTMESELDYAKVIVHEIAHQWWYAVVGNNEIKEAWLDESLAEYSTALFFEEYKEFGVSYESLISEAFAGYTLYADIVKSIEQKLNTSMLLSVNEYAGDYEYSYMIYVKGVLMFDNVRQVIGKERLIKGFKRYYKKYKFKVATTDDFIVSVKKASGKDVEGLFDSWLQGKTIIGAF